MLSQQHSIYKIKKMAGTIKTFDELANPTTGLLADNNVKAISALDVRTIVTSNYQPQMVYHGMIWNTTNGEGSWRVLYYNPDFFQYQNPTSPFNTDNIWQVTNGGSGMTDGTYTDVTITASTPVAPGTQNAGDVNIPVAAFGTKATVVVSGGALTSLTITSPGTGWINPSDVGTNGMTGTIDVPGGGTKPTLNFNGPIRSFARIGATEQVHEITTNATAQGSQSQADFTLINTCLQGYSWVGNPGNGVMMMSNATYPKNYLKYQTNSDKNMHITLWRVAANV